MMDDQIGFKLGQVMVSTTENRGHDVEFWATETTKKIVGISAEADPHIRQQAEAFQKPSLYSNIFGDEECHSLGSSDFARNACKSRS